jgi:hypothetical protein
MKSTLASQQKKFKPTLKNLMNKKKIRRGYISRFIIIIFNLAQSIKFFSLPLYVHMRGNIIKNFFFEERKKE